MRIAYVVPYVPNLIRTRPYNLISHLAALGNDVSVFTLGAGVNDIKDVEVVRSKVADVYYQNHSLWQSLWNCIKVLPSHRPLQTVYSWNRNLADKLTSLLSIPGRFDIVHVEHLRGSLYGQYVKSRIAEIPVIWDSVDCISYLFRQASENSTGGFGKFITRFELGRTQNMEGKLIGEFDHVLVTSGTDRSALLELASSDKISAPITILPNGVDLEYFHPNQGVEKEPETLVFSGKMSYHANISMVKYLVGEIMPKVWMERPNVRLMVVGKDPSADVRALAIDPRITVTGTVEDIRPYLWKACCAVVPLVYGAGIQNKILEAMACGTVVVTSPKTLSALRVEDGRDLFVASQPVEFAQKILMLIEDRQLREKIGSAGEKYVGNHHSWLNLAGQLVSCYKDTIQAVKNA